MKVKVELGNKTANPSNLVAIFSALSQSMDVVGLSPKIITAYIPLYNADGVLAEPIDKSGRVMNYLFRDKKFKKISTKRQELGCIGYKKETNKDGVDAYIPHVVPIGEESSLDSLIAYVYTFQ